MVKQKSRRKGRSAAFMRSINPYLNKRRKSRSTRRGVTMPRRRKSRRSFRRMSSGGLKPMQVLIGGGIYGAVRSKLSNLLAPITSKVPLGTIGDEAVLFVAAQQLGKRMRDKTIKSVASAAMAVEAARIGEAMIDGSAFGTSSNGGAAVSGFQTLG